MLAAAVREFAASGFAGARVDSIAERAGVNKQALYYHFGNKEQLFEAALASIYDQFPVAEPDWASGLSPVAAMEQFVGQMFDFMGEHQDANAMIADENRLHGSHLTPPVRQRVRQAVEPMIAAIAGILAHGQAQGVFARSVDATQLYLTMIALCMFSFVNAFTLSAIVGHDLLSEAALAARRRHVVAFVVAGLRA